MGNYYSNILNSDYVSAEDFATYDGGSTYYYVGGSYLTMTYLACGLTLSNTSPDEFYLTVDGENYGIGFNVDPARESGSSSLERYGMKFAGKISEVGTAKINHLAVYQHESYHDAIEAARVEMAKNDNYEMSYTLDFAGTDSDKTFSFIMTPETIDQRVTDAGGNLISHTGSHKNGDSAYYNYSLDETTGIPSITKNVDSAWDSVNRYPTFVFGSEIFADAVDGVYTSRVGAGTLMRYAMFLPTAFSAYDYGGTVDLTLKDGHLSTLSTKVDALDETLTINASYSKIGSATCAIDFSKAVADGLPATFQEANKSLFADMKDWSIDTVVPYLYSKVGWGNAVGWIRAADPLYAFFETDFFASADDCAEFIANYKSLLVSSGFVLSTKTQDDGGNYLYEKDGWGISVSPSLKYGGVPTDAAKIKVYGDGLTNPYA